MQRSDASSRIIILLTVKDAEQGLGKVSRLGENFTRIILKGVELVDVNAADKCGAFSKFEQNCLALTKKSAEEAREGSNKQIYTVKAKTDLQSEHISNAFEIFMSNSNWV